MRIALVGAGALGTAVGALIAKGGEDIVLVDVDEAHLAALNEKGAVICGKINETIPVTAVKPAGMTGTYDLIIYLAKTVYDDVAIPPVLGHMDENSVFLTLQNGIPEKKIANYVGQERTVGGTVGFPARLLAPGVSEIPAAEAEMYFEIGEIDGRVTPRLKAIQRILSHAAKTHIREDFAAMRWDKLLANVALSGVSTVMDNHFRAVIDNDKGLKIVIAIMVETIRTAKALGVEFSKWDPVFEMLTLDEAAALTAVRDQLSAIGSGYASMLQDLRKGRPCEVDAINGFLSEAAAEAGVAVPVNDQVTTIIREIAVGRRPLSSANLDRIKVPPLFELYPGCGR